jgi:hypothetical protein
LVKEILDLEEATSVKTVFELLQEQRKNMAIKQAGKKYLLDTLRIFPFTENIQQY